MPVRIVLLTAVRAMWEPVQALASAAPCARLPGGNRGRPGPHSSASFATHLPAYVGFEPVPLNGGV